jgi:hypothetical protein
VPFHVLRIDHLYVFSQADKSDSDQLREFIDTVEKKLTEIRAARSNLVVDPDETRRIIAAHGHPHG